ncbi:unnamed protein product [Allacma fusca]|uniref:Uncharacterized protein n=1 Tax=Allacma fusca TaxID=39272 RepID=A0A8J2L5K1_9HEXA|nr:unnamed protein product [Allacma fusca]
MLLVGPQEAKWSVEGTNRDKMTRNWSKDVLPSRGRNPSPPRPMVLDVSGVPDDDEWIFHNLYHLVSRSSLACTTANKYKGDDQQVHS